MGYRGWYERVYPELSGAGLWLRGGELNTLPLPFWEERPFRVLWARLSTYHDTADSFTHGLLYQITARLRGVFPDLAYLPPAADLGIFRRDGVPWLLGTQSKEGPYSFQLIGLSLSVVQELLNLPALLRESGLPLGKRERMARPELPLLLLGGASALYSSVAWGEDPWVDAVFMGESDVAIRRVLETLRDGSAAGLDKRALLDAIAGLPGVLLPDAPRPVRRAACTDLDEAEALVRAPVPFVRDRIGAGQLQLSQGCPCFCTFCAESWDRKPYRERSLPRLLELARAMKAGMALESLELFSASANAHGDLHALVAALAPELGRLRLKSQRFDLLAHDAALVEVERVLEKTSLTCGLEGISGRLRRYLRKSLPEEDLQRALELILASRPRELKVFLIATGLEEEEDFAELGALLERIARLGQRAAGARGGTTRCIFSMTPLVRFPWTPLELEDAPSPGACERVVRRAARLVRDHGFEFREAADLSEYWLSQVLVRADRPALAAALRRTLEETGFLYYRRVERGFLQALLARLREAGIEPDELLRGHSAAQAAHKPWAVVETAVDREFLWQAHAQARGFVDEGYCLGRAWLRAKCLRCGACSPEEVAALTARRPAASARPEELRARLRQERQAETEIRLRVEAGRAARGVPRRALAAALLQALFEEQPSLVPEFRRYGASHFEEEGRPVWLEGADVLGLTWSQRGERTIVAMAGDPRVRESVSRRLESWGSWLGLAPEEWSPDELHLRAPFGFTPDAYLASLGLKYTRRRLDEGRYRLELNSVARRKGLIVELEWRQLEGGGSEVHVRPGPKLRCEELLRRGFDLPSAGEWVRVEARVVGP